MEDGPKGITLANLGGGAANELFNAALDKVLKDIMDPNTEASAPREVLMKVRIVPNEKREVGDMHISVVPKLASFKTFETVAYIGRDRTGKLVAVESNPRQLGLDMTPTVQAITGGKKD